MFKEIFNSTSADTLSAVALVLFVSVFLAVLGWALTRRRSTVNRWARIPLEDEPVDPRTAGKNHAQEPRSADFPADDEAVSGIAVPLHEPQPALRPSQEERR